MPSMRLKKRNAAKGTEPGRQVGQDPDQESEHRKEKPGLKDKDRHQGRFLEADPEVGLRWKGSEDSHPSMVKVGRRGQDLGEGGLGA